MTTPAVPQPFRWAYDRSDWEGRVDATTFSVGLYQWLPKAAGGLKRSTTIRVSGYVARADTVYAKADELCERLNREQVRLDARPAWLQKSYAVPKPPDFEKPRRSTDLTAAEVRAIRNRVVKPLVLAAGYEQTHASTFGRRRDEMVSLMHFQTSSWGPTFTVNLGWHPTYVPAGRHRPEQMRWTDLEERECTVRGRLGFFLPTQLDAWWPFGSDPEALAGTIAQVTAWALDTLDQYGERLRQWCERPVGWMSLPSQVFPSYPTTLRACIDLRHGRFDAAADRLKAAMAEGREASVSWHEGLLAVVDRHRAAAAAVPARAVERVEWLTAS